MKTFSATIIASLFAISGMAQNVDPVVMRINGQPVTRSEFEYYYNKNGKGNCSLDEYKDLFINYRLKVDAAKKARFDTLTSFKKEYATYRDKQLRKYLVDSLYEDSVALSVYGRIKQQVGDSDILRVAHIFMPLPAKADTKMRDSVAVRMDSVYAQLQAGADFAAMAQKYSADASTSRMGGELPWIGPNSTIKEFEDVAYSLRPGQYSKPFQSAVGFHIVLMKERKKLDPYEMQRPMILKALREQGLDDMAANHEIAKRVRQSGGKLTRDDVMNQILDKYSAEQPELGRLAKEYHDGLLLFEVCKRDVWDPAERDTAGLQDYFKANKKNYKWDSPRFKGFAIHAKDKQMIADVKEILKQHANDWIPVIKQKYNSGKKPQVLVTRRLFKQGDDSLVDELVFKKGKAEVLKNYPCADVYGKLLKKSPETFEDVRGQVVSDYQDVKEKDWIQKLRDQSNVEVYKDVLATVDKH